MPELTLDEITRAVKGELSIPVETGASIKIRYYHFDTRLIHEPGTLFFALKSENRDGHEFVEKLAQQEGMAAVVCRDYDREDVTIPLIRVDDTQAAAEQLAAHVRKKYDHIKYIAVTGSAGKTTTKEFIYQLLSHKYKAYRSFKNWNNWIGMPFSLMNMNGDEYAVVFELAMSYPGIGEIDLLARILQPNAAVVLNTLPVHLEFLKTVENVAAAKTEIFNYLREGDVAFVNGDFPHLVIKADAKNGRKIYFGCENPGNDILLKEIVREGESNTMIVQWFGTEMSFETPFINQVHVENLFAASAVVHHVGMTHDEIRAAIRTLQPLTGRGDIKKLAGCTVIDETYNSNPEALKKTMDWVDREFDREKIAVVGDMLELGDNEDQFHREVGGFFAGLGYRRLITVGKRAEKIAEGAAASGFDPLFIKSFEKSPDAGAFLKQVAQPGSVVLFKASRGIRLELAIEEFEKNG